MANLDQISKSLEQFIVSNTRKVQADLLRGIAQDTPVRTGRARAGWESVKEVNKVGDTGVIENLVPYIGWLEFGSDTVAPQAMVRNNLKRVGDK